MHTSQPSDAHDPPKPFRIVAIDGPGHAIPGRPHIVLSHKVRPSECRRRMALSESGLLGQTDPALTVSPNLKVVRPEPAAPGLGSRPEGTGDIIAIGDRLPPPSRPGIVKLTEDPDGAA
jgi:hypothetical protein